MAKKFIKTCWLAQIEYPTPFVLGIIAQFLNYGVRYLIVYFMVVAFGNLNGWTALDMLFLYAVANCCYALGACMAFNTAQNLPELARTGFLNDYLIKPVHSLFYLVFSNFNVGYVSHLLLSTIVMIYVIFQAGISLNFLTLLWILISLVCGGVICACIMLILSFPSIIFLGNDSVFKLFYFLRDLIDYPLSIFGTVIQFIMTFIIPMGFINFYPVQVLLNKSDTTFLPTYVQYLSPLVAAIMVLLLIFTWEKTINKYESTGA